MELGEKDGLDGFAPPPPCSSYQRETRELEHVSRTWRLATANRRINLYPQPRIYIARCPGRMHQPPWVFQWRRHEFVFSVCAGRMQVRRAVLQLQRIRQASLLVHRGGQEPNRSSPRYPRYHCSLGLTQQALDVPLQRRLGQKSRSAMPR